MGLPGASTRIGEFSGGPGGLTAAGSFSADGSLTEGSITAALLAAGAVTDTAISSTSQVGRLLGTYRYVPATSSRATNTAAIQDALDAMSGVGEVLIHGYYPITQLRFPSRVRLRGIGSKHDTVLDGLMTGSQLGDSILTAGTEMVTAGTTTVAATNVVGTETLSISGLAGGTTTTAGFTQPAVGATVQAAVMATAGLVDGERVFVAGGGTYTASINDATHVTLRRIGTTGDVATGTVVASGKLLVPAILQVRASATGSNFCGAIYHVRDVSGSGPYTVTVERPILFLFGSGDGVVGYVEQVHDVEIANFTLTGSSQSRMIEFITARDCVWRKLNVRSFATGVGGDLACSFDSFGYGHRTEDVWIDAGGADAAMGLESNENSTLVRPTVRNASALIGIRVNDGANVTISKPTVTGCAWGVKGNPETTGNGPLRLLIDGGSLESNGIGVELLDCVDATMVGVRSRNNTWNVIADGSTVTVVGGTQSADGVRTGDYAYTSPSTYGVLAKNGAIVRGQYDTTNCVFGIRAEDTSRVYGSHRHHGVSGTDGNAQQSRISTAGSAIVDLDSVDIVMTAGYRAVQSNGGTVRIGRGRITGGASFVGLVAIAGAIRLANVDVSGFSAGNSFQASGGAIIFGDGMPYAQSDVTGGGLSNVGTVTLNGATGVPITVPSALGLVAGHEHRIALRLKTVGGTQGKDPAVIAGTNQFTVTGTAGDTSTYAWRVV